MNEQIYYFCCCVKLSYILKLKAKNIDCEIVIDTVLCLEQKAFCLCYS